MLTDILWEELQVSLDKKIATITSNYIINYYSGSHKKNPPIKLITDGFNCLILNYSFNFHIIANKIYIYKIFIFTR